MPHVIEPAASGRAKCRGCTRPIDKGEWRFGERQPNPFGDGELTLWFHVRCAAYQRPEPFLEAIASPDAPPAAVELAPAARFGVEHRQVPRLHGAERASTGRARCRACREFIDKNEWRIALAFFEDVRLSPGGFIHAGCAATYFGTIDLIDRLRHFSPELTAADLAELEHALRSPRSPPG